MIRRVQKCPPTKFANRSLESRLLAKHASQWNRISLQVRWPRQSRPGAQSAIGCGSSRYGLRSRSLLSVAQAAFCRRQAETFDHGPVVGRCSVKQGLVGNGGSRRFKSFGAMTISGSNQSLFELNSIDQINFLADTKDFVEVDQRVGTGELIDKLPHLD